MKTSSLRMLAVFCGAIALPGAGCEGRSVADDIFGGDAAPSTSSDVGPSVVFDAGSLLDAAFIPVRPGVCSEDGSAGCPPGNYCRAGRCQPNLCGDGVRLGNEDCDDGNARSGDGCDPSCRAEIRGCGDGRVGTSEECDDGNLVDGDTCSNRCTRNSCGNARVDFGEECDDGNFVADDNCSNKCAVVACRNGRIDPGEECDDGNGEDDDDCTNACRLSVCGNGKIEKHEECDDGNLNNDDECPNDCKIRCGNGIVDPGEECEHPVIAGGAYRSCSKQCKFVDDECTACIMRECDRTAPPGTPQPGEEENLAVQFGLASGCFKTVNAEFGANPADSTFIPQCVAVVQCALDHDCGWAKLENNADGGATGGPSACYCGSRGIDACASSGPAEDAPCVEEWKAAARAVSNAEVQQNFADLAMPLGWAYHMLGCMASSVTLSSAPTPPPFCRSACVPPEYR